MGQWDTHGSFSSQHGIDRVYRLAGRSGKDSARYRDAESKTQYCSWLATANSAPCPLRLAHLRISRIVPRAPGTGTWFFTLSMDYSLCRMTMGEYAAANGWRDSGV
jgi:hypothetical protein